VNGHTIHPSSLALSLAAIHAHARNAPRVTGASGSSIQSDFALRRIVQLVIRDHEFRPWQGDDDVVALHFDVEVVVVRHLAETRSSSVREPLYEPGGNRAAWLRFPKLLDSNGIKSASRGGRLDRLLQHQLPLLLHQGLCFKAMTTMTECK
jgi:hypothetical protein